MNIDISKYKGFLNQPNIKEAIQRGEFASVYNAANKEMSPSAIRGLTQIFMRAEIDPLAYMEEVPEHYLFHDDEIREISLPQSIQIIKRSAFAGCENLALIEMPIKVKVLEWNCFKDCSNPLKIVYRGTKKQWSEISKDEEFYDSAPALLVECVDGELSFEPFDIDEAGNVVDDACRMLWGDGILEPNIQNGQGFDVYILENGSGNYFWDWETEVDILKKIYRTISNPQSRVKAFAIFLQQNAAFEYIEDED